VDAEDGVTNVTFSAEDAPRPLGGHLPPALRRLWRAAQEAERANDFPRAQNLLRLFGQERERYLRYGVDATPNYYYEPRCRANPSGRI
jgi:hypothetical protein